MRSPGLLLASLAAPLFFISPAQAVDILPPCCGAQGQTRPPKSHPPDRHPEEETPRFLVPAEVRSPDERALEAAAEALIPVEVPLVNAIGVPLEERPGVSEPAYLSKRARIVEPPPLRVDADIEGLSCCQTEGETHPPDRHPEEATPILVPAKIRDRDGRALEAAAEVPIPAEVPLVDAIGIPLEERPGVSEPEFVPASANGRPAWLPGMQINAQLIIALFVILLAITFVLSRQRRPRPEQEAVPDRPPLPEELSRLVAAPVPPFEPFRASAVKAAPARELEPA